MARVDEDTAVKITSASRQVLLHRQLYLRLIILAGPLLIVDHCQRYADPMRGTHVRAREKKIELKWLRTFSDQ